MRDRDCPDTAERLDFCDRLMVEESNAIPKQVPSGQLKEERALANREFRLSTDSEQLGCLFLEPVVMVGGKLFHRRPCLSLMTNILPFVGADRARFRRRGGLAELGAALHTDEVWHGLSDADLPACIAQ